MSSRPLSIRVDPRLIDRIDNARGDVPRTRWLVRAMEAALAESEGAPVPRRKPRSNVEPRRRSRAAREYVGCPEHGDAGAVHTPSGHRCGFPGCAERARLVGR